MSKYNPSIKGINAHCPLRSIRAASLAFLDDEYQKSNNITLDEINTYSKFSIIFFENIVTSPASFIESDSVRKSIWTNPIFSSCNVIQTKNIDSTLEAYQRVRKVYHPNSKYKDGKDMDMLLRNVNLQGVQPQGNKSMAYLIKHMWKEHYQQSDIEFSTDKIENDSFLEYMSQIPQVMQGGIFAPNNINENLKKFEGRWATPLILTYNEKLMLKLYFSAFCEKGDILITCKSPFLTGGNRRDLYLPNEYKTKIMPIHSLIGAALNAGYYQCIINMSLDNVIELAHSEECKLYRESCVIDFCNIIRCVDPIAEQLFVEKAIEKAENNVAISLSTVDNKEALVDHDKAPTAKFIDNIKLGVVEGPRDAAKKISSAFFIALLLLLLLFLIAPIQGHLPEWFCIQGKFSQYFDVCTSKSSEQEDNSSDVKIINKDTNTVNYDAQFELKKSCFSTSKDLRVNEDIVHPLCTSSAYVPYSIFLK